MYISADTDPPPQSFSAKLFLHMTKMIHQKCVCVGVGVCVYVIRRNSNQEKKLKFEHMKEKK